MWTRTRTDGLACLAHDTASSLVQGRPRCCSHHKAQARALQVNQHHAKCHTRPRESEADPAAADCRGCVRLQSVRLPRRSPPSPQRPAWMQEHVDY